MADCEPVDLDAIEEQIKLDAWSWVMNKADDDVPAMIAEIRELRDLGVSDMDRIIELEELRDWALDEIARLERVNARLEAQVKFAVAAISLEATKRSVARP